MLRWTLQRKLPCHYPGGTPRNHVTYLCTSSHSEIDITPCMTRGTGWWQAEISGDHQLRLVVYPPWFTRLKCIPGGCLGFLKHQPEHSSTSVRWEMDPGNRGDWNSKSQRLEELEGQFLSLGIQSPCQMMIGMYNPLLSKVFRFHYHSQKVIGSPGFNVFLLAKFNWSFPFESMFKSREVL